MYKQELINKVMSHIIDRDKFISVCKDEISNNQFNGLMEMVLDIDDSDLVSNVFLIGFSIDGFNETNREIILKLLTLNYHKNHEDIAGLFQRNYCNDEDNIPILLNAIHTIPDYLSPDDFKYPYIRKLIYAIGAQPEPYNFDALEKLANETNDEEIKKLALHQIEKRNELGRWEAAKNHQ